MGGDGGTLNNTRAEHATIRRSAAVRRIDSSARASVRECTLTQEELIPAEVVVDAAGQLYNKSALLENLLNGGTGVSHIRKLSRDVAKVQFERDESGAPLCAVTRAVARPDGTFSVGWICGCVVATIETTNDEECPACGEPGTRVHLGQTVAERMTIIDKLLAEHAARRKRKRQNNEAGFGKPKKGKIAD